MSQVNWPIFPTLPADPGSSTDLTTWQIWQIKCDVLLKSYKMQLGEFAVSETAQPRSDKQTLLNIVQGLLTASTTTPANAVANAQAIFAAYQAATNFAPAPV
jgi:hypothetical protein